MILGEDWGIQSRKKQKDEAPVVTSRAGAIVSWGCGLEFKLFI